MKIHWYTFFYPLGAAVVSACLIPFASYLAKRFNILDKPDHRKVHTSPTPYLGGIAIFLSFALLLTAFQILEHPFGYKKYFALLIGGGSIFTLGLLDDIFNIPAKIKLFLQIVIACIPVLLGITIKHFTIPLIGAVKLGVLADPLTVLWFVFLLNAINLIDGLDGLASGVVIISALFFGIINMIGLHGEISTISFILAASTFGFWLFNKPPAKIFMGDAGSLLLGYVLAFLSVITKHKSSLTITLLVPVVLLLIPIYDTLSAIIRRLRRGQHPFTADKEHLHHRLFNLGVSYNKILLIIYLFNTYLGILAVLVSVLRDTDSWRLVIIAASGLGILVGVITLNLFERRSSSQISRQTPNDQDH